MHNKKIIIPNIKPTIPDDTVITKKGTTGYFKINQHIFSSHSTEIIVKYIDFQRSAKITRIRK
jgi:hypothetical protein